MNHFRAISLLGWALAAAAAAAETTAFFANGDRLPATLAALDGPAARFESSALSSPATINLSQLLELRGEPATPEIKADHEAVVTLTNGNVLRGQLGALTDASVVLDTWFAGRVTLRRTMVDSLRVIDCARSLYSGPQGPEGWIQSNKESPAWQIDGGVMTASRPGSAARDLDLPDRISVAFDLAWRGNLRMRLVVFSDDPAIDAPPNAYILDLNRRYVSLIKHWGAGNHRSTIGNAGATQLGENEKVHVEFLADRAEGTFLLRIDGEQINDAPWRDPDVDGSITGGGIHFVAEDLTPLRISRIHVEAWDGRIDGAGAAGESDPQEEIPADSQRIRLRNGDVVIGRVLGVEDGRLTIESKHAKIHLPVGRMNSVDLYREADKKNTQIYQRPKRMNGDVRAWFPAGGCLVFRLDGIDGDHFIGFNQAFGTARIRRDAFNRIEFNIYLDELEPLRPSAGGW